MMSWKLVKSEAIVENKWLRIERNVYDTPDGLVNDYYVVRRKAFVLVVAEHARNVILVKQYRPATGKSYWALPAGYVEKDETPEDAARRELAEETGYEGNSARLIASLDPLPGYIDSRAYVVVCTASPNPASTADREVSDVEERSRDAIKDMILAGEISEMQAVAALLFALAATDQAVDGGLRE